MKNNVHIIGGGIIGLCTAWYLHQEGCQVTVLDKGTFSEGTSYGNAGMIVPSHFVPMAAPGVVSQGLKWMLNRKSPFYVKPRLNSDLIQWLWHFYRSANIQKVEKAMPTLYELNERSKLLYKSMTEHNGFDFGLEERGLLMLYKSKKQEKEEEKIAEKAIQLGLAAELLDVNGLNILEPDMNLDVLGGLYFPEDCHLSPHKLMAQLKVFLKQKGVEFIPNTYIIDFEIKASKVSALIKQDGKKIAVDKVLLSAGSWSVQILKKAGIKILLQDGKGYSITVDKPKQHPKIPTILSEAKVAITPMGDSLRVGGTLELSGLSQRINQARVQGIIESIPKYYKNLTLKIEEGTEIWKGYRPCTPDGMPYIDKSKNVSNLYVGTGHGMMGLSLGAITGKIMSQMMTDQPTSVSTDLFRLDRFNS
jgi:D-amino-acid dehydrogenase